MSTGSWLTRRAASLVGALVTMTFGEDWVWGRRRVTRDADLFADAAARHRPRRTSSNGSVGDIVGELLKGRRARFVLATKFTNQTTR